MASPAAVRPRVLTHNDAHPRRYPHCGQPLGMNNTGGSSVHPAARPPGDQPGPQPDPPGGHPPTRVPADPGTRRPGYPPTRVPADPGTRRPGYPPTRVPADPGARRPGRPRICGRPVDLREIEDPPGKGPLAKAWSAGQVVRIPSTTTRTGHDPGEFVVVYAFWPQKRTQRQNYADLLRWPASIEVRHRSRGYVWLPDRRS